MFYFGNQNVSPVFRQLSTAALIVAGVTTLSACGSVRSLQPGSLDSNVNNRIYAGAGALLSRLEPDTSRVEGVDVGDSDSSGIGLMLGYDVTNRFSVEGHIADLGQSELSPEGSISYQVIGLSALVYGFNKQEDRTQRRGLSAFGRLGLGTLNNDAEIVQYARVNDVHLLAGAGLEYGFDNGLAARVELLAHETDAKYAQLALLYRFGGRTNNRQRVAPVPVVPEINETPEVAVTPLPLPETVVIDEPVIAAPEPLPEPVIEPVDSDLDGVIDDIDSCPGTATGLPVNAQGCEIFDGTIEGINFLTGSADLTDGARLVLTDVVGSLKAYPDINISIEAHTDNRGDAEQNLQLSKRRALAVARFLVDQGISGLRLKPQAYGESQPRSGNSTAEGRAANRRVEFSVIK